MVDPPFRLSPFQNPVRISNSQYLIVDIQLWINPVSYTPTTYGAGPPFEPDPTPPSNGWYTTENNLTAANLIIDGPQSDENYSYVGFPTGPISLSIPAGGQGDMWQVPTEVDCVLDDPFTGQDHTSNPNGFYQLSFDFLAWTPCSSGPKYNQKIWAWGHWVTAGQFWIIGPNATEEFQYSTNILCNETLDFSGATIIDSRMTETITYRAIGTMDPWLMYLPYNVKVVPDPHGLHTGEVYNGFYRTGYPPVKHVIRIIFKSEEPTA